MTNLIEITQRGSRAETLKAAMDLAAQRAQSSACEVMLLATSVDIEGSVLEEVLGKEPTKQFKKDRNITYQNVIFKLLTPTNVSFNLQGVLLSINSFDKTLQTVEKHLKLKVLHDVIVHWSFDEEPSRLPFLNGKIYTSQ